MEDQLVNSILEGTERRHAVGRWFEAVAAGAGKR